MCREKQEDMFFPAFFIWCGMFQSGNGYDTSSLYNPQNQYNLDGQKMTDSINGELPAMICLLL